MNTAVTRTIHRLVHKARTDYEASKNALHGGIEAAEEEINRRFRGYSEELNAMQAMGFIRRTDSHIYILLIP